MDFNLFTEEIIERLSKKFDDYQTITVKECIKNNGIKLTGLIVSDDKRNISPTIYLNDFYKSYENNEFDLDEIALEIFLIYRHSELDSDLEIERFTDYNRAKDYIVYKLINYSKNYELLEEVPHIRYLDLAICFYYRFEDKQFDNATILINNLHLKSWGVSLLDVHEVAKRNTPSLLPANICDMYTMMMERFADDECRHQLENQREFLENQMYILSNKSMLYGASTILYPNVMGDFANKIKRNFYIIPSSIHELILIPDNDTIEKETLYEMVKSVNNTEVPYADVLSDNVYYYDMKMNEVISMY